MGREAFAIVDGIRSARLGTVLGSGEPLFWPATEPPCTACKEPVAHVDAHSFTEDGRIVIVHRDCCPLCAKGGW